VQHVQDTAQTDWLLLKPRTQTGTALREPERDTALPCWEPWMLGAMDAGDERIASPLERCADLQVLMD